MGSLADHIQMGLYPEEEEQSIIDKLLHYFSRTMIGAGSPEGNVAAPVGAEYTNITTGRKYVKTGGGEGNTGWVVLLIAGEGGGGGGGELTDGDKGDVTVSDLGTVWTIDNGVVSLAKLANIAQGSVIGREAGAGTGAPTLLDSSDLSTILGLGSAAFTASAAYDAAGSAFAAQEFARARANHTGTQSTDTLTDGATSKVLTNALKTKLDGIATGATANDTDANLKARANHTGTQNLDTTTDSATRLAMLAAERTKLTGIATGATANDTDANLKNRANHTGAQAISTVTNLQTTLDEKVPKLRTINNEAASYTLALTDAGEVVEMQVAGANNLTVPPNSTVAFSVGTEILIIQYGAGATTIVPGAGVTLRALSGNLVLAGQYGWAKLLKRATNEWEVVVHGTIPGPRELARQQMITAQTGIAGTAVDLNNCSIAFDVVNYPVDVLVEVPYAFAAGAGGCNCVLEIYDTSGAVIKRSALFPNMPGAGTFSFARVVERITTVGSHVRKGRALRSSGTSTLSISVAGTEASTGCFISATEVVV